MEMTRLGDSATAPTTRARRIGLAAWIAFVVVAIASLGFISLIDAGAWALATRHAPSLSFIGRYRVASLAASVVLAMALADRRAFGLPKKDTPWRLVGRVAFLWTVGTAIALLWAKVWTPTVGFRDAADYVAFLGTGLLGEELIFRGILFGVASTVLPDAPGSRLGPIVWASAVLFAGAHVQYHHFRLSPAAAMQVLYTLPMGLVLAFIRKHTGSIWPGTAVHLVCNVFAVLSGAA
jgi:membrane protease YdiL (CAAX protease family)